MEDLPRKAGFTPAGGGKPLKPPSLITDSSLKISRVEATPSPTLDFPAPEEWVETEEDMPWRPKVQSRPLSRTTLSSSTNEDFVSSSTDDVSLIEVPALPLKQKRGWQVGAAIASATVAALGGVGVWLWNSRPRDPSFSVELITLDGFNLRFCTDSPLLLAVVDISLTLHVNSTNPNVSPIVFSDTIMDIFYRGTLLGQAKVPAGEQAAYSTSVMELRCKLDGLELTNHIKDLFCDVTKREMWLHSVVTITGESLVWRWRHPFKVYVNSDIKVDPIFFDVLDQENRAKLEMSADWHIR